VTGARQWLLLPALLCWASAAQALPGAPPGGDGDGGQPGEMRQRADDAYAVGRDALASGDALAAMAAFRAALREDPALVAALNGMGVALDRVGRFDLARPYYETALALEPAAADILYNFALSLSLQGLDEAARPLLTKAAGLGESVIRQNALALMARIDARRQRSAMVLAADLPAEAPASAPEAAARLVRVGQGEWMLDEAADAATESPAVLAAVPRWTAADEAALVAAEDALATAAETAQSPAASSAPAAAATKLAAVAAPTDPALSPGPAGSPAPTPPLQRRETALAGPVIADRRLLQLGSTGHLLWWEPRRHANQPWPLPLPRSSTPAPNRFATPFASDDHRLNAFAERMQGHGTDSIGRPRTAPAADRDRATLAALTAALATAPSATAAPSAPAAFASDDILLNAFAARLAG
jgi:hypothetical protein